MPFSLASITRAVEAKHGVRAIFEGFATIREITIGTTVWRGPLNVFILEDHPTAQKAYAWAWKHDDGEVRYMTVLDAPPFQSLRAAVQAAFEREDRPAEER